MPVVIWRLVERRRTGRAAARWKAYFAWLLLLEAMMVGVFAATDVFLFYVFFEAMLVPMYFLIGSFGGPRRQYAAVKFFLYSLVGGLIMLAAVIGLYVVSSSQLGEAPSPSTRCASSTSPRACRSCCSSASSSRSRSRRRWCRSTPGCPTPVPRRPIGGAVLLVGVLDKVGTFGFLRYCLPLFPDASRVLRAAGSWCSPSSASSTPRCWPWARAT